MRLTLFLLGLLCSSSIWGQNITEANALKIGKDFLSEKKEFFDHSARNSYEDGEYELAYISVKDGKVCYYVFNNKSGGYIIVSADNRTTAPILGYSTEGYFDYESLNDASKYWMDSYSEQICSLSDSSESISGSPKKTFERSIEPLLGNTSWGQYEPYNLLCPEIDGERCVTGCGPTAMAQIMYHHKWPERGQGMISYVSDSQLIEADLSESIYEWEKMQPTYDENSSIESQMAVALLMRDCGYAAGTQYGIRVSDTFAHEAHYWIRNFDYDKGIRILPRDFFDDESWDVLLWTELDKGRPVIYEGGGENGSHIFICDGCDQDGYFHFNFGWDGRENGYFLSSANKYPMGQYMICGLEKNRGGESVLDFLSSTSFYYDESDNYFRFGEACLCNVGDGLEEINEKAILGVAIENVDSGKTFYIEVEKYSLPYCPAIRKYEILNNIKEMAELTDGEYRIHPICRKDDDIDGWVFCKFKSSCSQKYVSLTVTNGNYSFRNEGLESISDSMAFINGVFYSLNDEKSTATVTVADDMKGFYSGSIIIPETIQIDGKVYTVDAIGDGTFYGCEWVNSISIPRTIKYIGKEAFKGIYLMEDIIFPEDSELEYIDDYAFDCMLGWKKLVLPNKLKTIGNCAFRSVDGLTYLYIPESVTEIGYDAFMWSNSLKELFVYWNEPLQLKSNVFSGTILSRINLNVPEGTAELYEQVAPWSDFLIHDGNDWIEEEVIIDNIHYLLRTPDMTAKIKNIEPGSYSSIYFPESISYNNKEYIVTEVEDHAASAYDLIDLNINEIYIPQSIKSIGESAFEAQHNLIKVEFEENSMLNNLGLACFSNCTALRHITLPKNLKYISAVAFQNCDNLTDIDIPASVEFIDQDVFRDCPSLKDVTVHWLKPPLGIHSWAFSNADYPQMCLHVPYGTKDVYESIAPWVLFGQIIEDVDPTFEIPVESITLTPDSWSGLEGEQFKIKAQIYPENASYPALEWSSSDETVAFVYNDGVVVVDNEGQCVITVKALDGSGVTAECIVTSTSGIDSIYSDGDLLDVYNYSGILLKKDCDREYLRFLLPGVYIIKQGNKTKKVIIR